MSDTPWTLEYFKPGEPFVATGGVITIDGDYTVHTFLVSGDFTIVSGHRKLRRLIVAGGGPGGSINGSGVGTGGGGAGGVRDLDDPTMMGAGVYPVVVGDGGLPSQSTDGNDGSNSSFDGDVSLGGGRGGGVGDAPGNPGGSGGGGSAINSGGTVGSLGTAGQGHNGAAGRAGQKGGGGGGAGADAVLSDGGIGIQSDIDGTNRYYGGGGGGLSNDGSGPGGTGAGGLGGGGYANATLGTDGTDGLGGGGGGCGGGPRFGGKGGKGRVTIRYRTLGL